MHHFHAHNFKYFAFMSTTVATVEARVRSLRHLVAPAAAGGLH